MCEFLFPIIGLFAGGVGYLIVNFWMTPLLKYLEIKHQVTSDLVFYANVINANGMNERMEKLLLERRESNRKHAAEIRASFFRLPKWYRYILCSRNEDPVAASKNLICLSNTHEEDQATKVINTLKKNLNINDNINE
jgi:hypothetical protein